MSRDFREFSTKFARTKSLPARHIFSLLIRTSLIIGKSIKNVFFFFFLILRLFIAVAVHHFAQFLTFLFLSFQRQLKQIPSYHESKAFNRTWQQKFWHVPACWFSCSPTCVRYFYPSLRYQIHPLRRKFHLHRLRVFHGKTVHDSVNRIFVDILLCTCEK